MDKTYYIFGLYIQSAIPLPTLSSFAPHEVGVPDVIIEYGATPDQLDRPQYKGVRYQCGPGEFLFHVDSVAHYYVSKGRRIIVTPVPGAAEERILIFLLGSAMGALLHQRNILVMHAGAIAVNGRSVLFSGCSGVGKSTLVAGFNQRGYPFLADDLCVISVVDGKPSVVPGFPYLKLWADVLTKLDKDKDQLKSALWTKGLHKYFLPVASPQKIPIVLQSIFVLTTTNTEKIEIADLKGGEKIQPILKNTYRRRFLNGLGGKNEHFRQCGLVAAQTNVYKVTRPDKGFLLNDLMDMLAVNF